MKRSLRAIIVPITLKEEKSQHTTKYSKTFMILINITDSFQEIQFPIILFQFTLYFIFKNETVLPIYYNLYISQFDKKT